MNDTLFSDEYFMRQALNEAKIALASGEVPVGSVVVSENKIIARGHNQVEKLEDATAHAEMIALTAAFTSLHSKYLQECIMYVTVEPCAMCAGALHWAKLGRLVYALDDPEKGFTHYTPKILHPATSVYSGLLAADAAALLDTFFKKIRK